MNTLTILICALFQICCFARPSEGESPGAEMPRCDKSKLNYCRAESDKDQASTLEEIQASENRKSQITNEILSIDTFTQKLNAKSSAQIANQFLANSELLFLRTILGNKRRNQPESEKKFDAFSFSDFFEVDPEQLRWTDHFVSEQIDIFQKYLIEIQDEQIKISAIKTENSNKIATLRAKETEFIQYLNRLNTAYSQHVYRYNFGCEEQFCQ